MKLNTIEPYIKFKKDCEFQKEIFKTKVENFKNSGKKICGYAAAAKSTTVLNYCKIGNETIDFIADSTKEKIGKFSPGMHIPIVPPNYLTDDNPDYALLFAYNYFDEVMEKEKDFIERGGRFIVPLPEPKIIEP